MAAAVNVTMGVEFWTDELTLSAPSADADAYPASNMQSAPPSRVWRSPSLSLADCTITGESSELLPFNSLWLCGHNFTRDALVRRRLYRVEGGNETLVHDSGWRGWLDTVYTFDQVDHDGGNLHDRTYPPRKLRNVTKDDRYFIEAPIYANKVTFEIDDALNGDGFVEVGVLAAELAVTFSINPIESTARPGRRIRTQSTEAEGGHKQFDTRKAPRTFSGSINYIGEDEAKGVLGDHFEGFDLSKPFTWWPNRADPIHSMRDAFLARHASIDSLQHLTGGLMGADLNLEEVIG